MFDTGGLLFVLVIIIGYTRRTSNTLPSSPIQFWANGSVSSPKFVNGINIHSASGVGSGAYTVHRAGVGFSSSTNRSSASKCFNRWKRRADTEDVGLYGSYGKSDEEIGTTTNDQTESTVSTPKNLPGIRSG
jgi:hypothetical protein